VTISDSKPILDVKDLEVEFATYGGTVKAVRGVSLEVRAGEVLAIVGESGSGKSVLVQSLMGLTPCPPGKVTSGTAMMEGKDLLHLSRSEMESMRGFALSMIFQDPLTSLNPTMTVGQQIAEVIIRHRKISQSEANKEVVDLMKLVQIPEAASRLKQYPHEFSGGMRQRIMIAIALACRPRVLIADEPTTALDVTIQGQILELMKKLIKEIDMAVILITHDLAVVASIADRVAVMYAGEIVETGYVDEIFRNPSHPYTQGLQAAIPNPLLADERDLNAIPGSPPDMFSPPQGCAFAARCKYAMEVCDSFSPPKFDVESKIAPRVSACWLHHASSPKHLREVVSVRL
jgi:oligopeptide transport system ATP-binding protein